MQVQLSERVKTILYTLSNDDRARVNAWLSYLSNWEEDPFVKEHSVVLDVPGEHMYMFRTSTEVRIFYTVDLEQQIVRVVDVASRETILSSGTATAGAT